MKKYLVLFILVASSAGCSFAAEDDDSVIPVIEALRVVEEENTLIPSIIGPKEAPNINLRP